MLKIDGKMETEKIGAFLKTTLKKAGFEKVAVAVSGGVDSATALSICVKALGAGNVLAVKMPYGKQDMDNADLIISSLQIPEPNVFTVDIKPIVDVILGSLAGQDDSRIKTLLDSGQARMTNIEADLIRIGNIMARARMIILFDLAKANNCLVCGTENKSEHLLGYYTRFGDEASDIEPIRHLYKTQVYQLAKYLKIPQGILQKAPTAGLWGGQSDEKELGFTYNEADEILYNVFGNNVSWRECKVQSFDFAQDKRAKCPPAMLRKAKRAGKAKLKVNEEIIDKIQKRVEGNWFKKEVPYLTT